MRKIANIILAIVLPLAFLTIAAPRQAIAEDPFDPYRGMCEKAAANNNGNAPAACEPTDTNPISGQDSLLAKAVTIVSIVAGVIAVVMLMYNGVKIMLSAGDTAKFEKARNSLIFITVGIAIIVLARTIITFILERI